MSNIDAELARLIAPGRVHRRLYTDPAIFELEMERIFDAAWVYVGHESQIKKPGDYFATRMGRKPVVLVRDDEGTVRVIHNQCAHRGAMVVATDKGNTAEFICCYTSTQRRPEKPLVDTGGQVDSGVVDDSPWIFVRSGARRTDSGRAGWPCGAPGGAAGERDCFFLRRLGLRGGRGGAFVWRRDRGRGGWGVLEGGHWRG